MKKQKGITLIEQSAKLGFTLIELSIVLVIIGLIVGGVLSGKDLIRAAIIRASIGQIERYETAANAFRTKYGGLPGDMDDPTNFGFVAPGGAVTLVGNNLIDRSVDDAVQFDYEAAAFFPELSAANLISEYIAGAANFSAAVDDISLFAPAVKMNKSVRMVVYAHSGANYFGLLNLSVTDGAVTSDNASSEISVIDAFGFDNKLDDGYPATGRVVAITSMTALDAGAAAANDICVNTTPTPDAYNTGTQARADDTECSLRVRASF
jgi:prepilin-type N-terminal cleavage/methylation domain-containing protein